MRLYLRILSYLWPHRWVFVAAVVSTSVFAALDAYSLVLLLPFLQALFGTREEEGGAGEGEAGAGEAVGATAAEGGAGAVRDGAATGEGGAGAVQEDPAPGGDPEVEADNPALEWLLQETVGRFVDMAGPPADAVRGIILFILVIFLAKNVFAFLKMYLVAWVEQAVTRDLRDQVYDHLVDLDMGFFGRTRVGQVISRLTHDVEQLRTLVTKELSKIISSVFEFLAMAVVMVLISWQLTLAALVVLPGVFAIWGPFLRRLRGRDRKVLDLAADVHSHIQETVSGIRLVKASTAEDQARGSFRELTSRYFRRFVRTERLRALSQPLTETVGALGTVILLWYGAHLVLTTGDLAGEELITFLALSMKLYSPVKYLGKLPAIIQPGLVGGERLFEFLDAPLEEKENPDARPFPGVRREIAYEGVGFRYREGEPVLRDITFTAPKGSVTALVGPSGAGKTTLVDLLARFHDPTEGRIAVDGVDLRAFSLRSLREKLGVVSQDTVLFQDTVRRNIAYGLDSADHDAVEAAARAAHAHEFITRLPQGYDTVVGERGADLSGGQRQRIAIARAILRDPPILILDEATSALDSEAERLVQQAMEGLLEGRTVFVIAHRLSTVQRADRILVLDGGRIVEEGDHETLLAQGGLYRYFHDLQFSRRTVPEGRPPGGFPGAGAPAGSSSELGPERDEGGEP